jgi:hypothetical protein
LEGLVEMEDLNTIKNIVKDLLEKYPHTRNSDKFMYFLLLSPVLKVMTYEEFDKLFPYNFESLRRMRQKIFEESPELRGEDSVQEMRDKRKEEFKGYFGKKEEDGIIESYPRKVRGIEVDTIIKKGIALY